MCGGEEEYLSCRGMLTFELRPGRGVGPFELGLPVCVCVCLASFVLDEERWEV